MNRKLLTALSVVLTALIIILPRPSDNRYHVESIIDYEKGVNVHYPRTGNEELDRDIYSFISREIREHEESGRQNALLSISFDCYSSLFTVIRFNITVQQEKLTRTDRFTASRHRYFFTLTRGGDTAYSSESVQSSAGAQDITYGKKLVALTFDDGPSEYTSEILEILDSHGVRATFCVLGNKVSSHRSTIEIMHSGGHEIANHTYNHKKLTSLENDEMLEEVQKTQEAVYDVTGEYPSFLRPTYGAINSKVRSGINMPLLMWNKDTMDWKSRNSDYIFQQAISNLKDGDIILFHDIYPSTVRAIDKLIPYLAEKGYQPVTVSELLALRGIEASGGKAYFSSGDST